MYKLVTDKSNISTIFIQNSAMICPFTPPMIIPGKVQGSLNSQNRTCNSRCPLFEYVEANTGNSGDVVNLYCGNGRKIPVEVTKDKPIAEA